MVTDTDYTKGMEYLVEVIQRLSLARDRESVINIIRQAARNLTGADGASFILREGDLCSYIDEDAIGPLWKGRRFPMSHCVSGWVMLNHQHVIIEDIFQDPRVPVEAYRPTFVKSIAMVPIRKEKPIGAIGNYWAVPYRATESQMRLLEALADATAVALENVRLVDDLQKANSTLENSLAARDEFISVASHEMKTPLTAMILQLQMTLRSLKNDKLDAGMFQKNLELSIRQSHVMTELIEKLLDLPRIRSGNMGLHISPLDLSTFVSDVMERNRPLMLQARCELELSLAPDVKIQCDRSRMEQVLLALISNACKYARGKPVRVALKAPDHGVVTLEVADQGPGISSDVQKRIFERFERGVSSRNESGLGLGLYIAKNVVDAHGGRLRVDSHEGEGSVFTVELPCFDMPALS